MADVRTLLAAERSSRRISHPHLSYTKSGLLQCTACNLNIRSESLWEGHLKSANHRRNAGAALDPVPVSKKRKIDDGESGPQQEETRKKTKSVRFKGVPEDFWDAGINELDEKEVIPSTQDAGAGFEDSNLPPKSSSSEQSNGSTKVLESDEAPTWPAATPQATQPVDEDEWAAFERDLAPLTKPPPPAPLASAVDYSSATISAPALSAAEIEAAAQQAAQQQSRKDRDAEAQDEKEESEARMQDEFAVMEEMEERVRRLREKREALRHSAADAGLDTGQADKNQVEMEDAEEEQKASTEESDEDDDDEVDDWFS